jgi:hypothetical protein
VFTPDGRYASNNSDQFVEHPNRRHELPPEEAGAAMRYALSAVEQNTLGNPQILLPHHLGQSAAA